MLVNRQHNLAICLFTLLLAMGLKIVPLPHYLSSLNPDWVLLVLIYWTLLMPEKIGVFSALVIGLLVDVLTGRILGQSALSYILISYSCLKFHRRLRQYPLPQQSLFVFFCLMFSQFLMFWIEKVQSSTEFNLMFFLPVLSGTLLWPALYFGLHYLRLFVDFGEHG